jgi:hypothetical protein
LKCENRLVPSKCNKCITAHGYGCYLCIQTTLQRISDAIFDFDAGEADSSYALARNVSVLDAVNWIGLAVKKIKAETAEKYFAKAGAWGN